MIKNKEYTIFMQFCIRFISVCVNRSVDCVWLYAYVNYFACDISMNNGKKPVLKNKKY